MADILTYNCGIHTSPGDGLAVGSHHTNTIQYCHSPHQYTIQYCHSPHQYTIQYCHSPHQYTIQYCHSPHQYTIQYCHSPHQYTIQYCHSPHQYTIQYCHSPHQYTIQYCHSPHQYTIQYCHSPHQYTIQYCHSPHQCWIQSVSRKEDFSIVIHHTTRLLLLFPSVEKPIQGVIVTKKTHDTILPLTTPHLYWIQSVSRKEDYSIFTHHTTPILNTVRQSKRRLQCCHSPHHTNTEYSPSVEKKITVLSLTTPHQYWIQSVSWKEDYSVVTHHTTPILNTVRQSKRRLQCCHSPHHTNTEYSPSVEKKTTVLSLTTPHQY